MKYPKLVPEAVCRTPCRVTLYAEGISEDGERNQAFSADLKCVFQSGAKRVKISEHEEVSLSGEAFFSSDFCPDLIEIPDGKLEIFGHERDIIIGQKARNPDGTVNYIRLGVK